MDVVNWHTLFFYLFSLLTCAFGIAVVVSSNIVRMAFYLIMSLGAGSGLFFLAGADFVGAMQLLIYVGGTLVLLVFGVMLTAQGQFISMRTASGDWLAAVLLSGCLLALLVPAAFSVSGWRNEVSDETGPRLPVVQTNTSTPIGMGLLGVRVDKLDVSPATGEGKSTPDRRPGMSGYLLPFEIVSVHLLVVLIGAAYLARTKRRATAGGAR